MPKVLTLADEVKALCYKKHKQEAKYPSDCPLCYEIDDLAQRVGEMEKEYVRLSESAYWDKRR